MANNPKSLLNGNKSIVRKNLGLCKHSEIYLKNIAVDQMLYKNIDLARKDMSNKLMVFKGNREKAKFCCLAEKGHVWKESGVTTQGKRKLEVYTILLSNEKIITDNVVNFF